MDYDFPMLWTPGPTSHPLTQEDVVGRAAAALADFPNIAKNVNEHRISKSVAVTWPAPPAPLIYWLFVAGDSRFYGSSAARDCLKSLDNMLLILSDISVVTGNWQGRISKLLPARKKAASLDHLTEFRSALFELMLCFQIVPFFQLGKTGWSLTLENDRDEQGGNRSDISISLAGCSVAAIEAYAPQKGIKDWFESELVHPWNSLIGKSGDISDQRQSADIFLDGEAINKALSRILTDSNFKDQKAKQLSSGTMPTILAVRAYGLTPKIENLLTLKSASDIAASIGTDAWGNLPERCVGMLLCFTTDVLFGGGSLVFIPAPGRTLTSEVEDFLSVIEAI